MNRGHTGVYPGHLRRYDRTAPAASGTKLARAEAIAPDLWEAFGIWLLFGALTLAILIDYATHPAADFYHVSHSGLAGGVGRALVYLNFPVLIPALTLLGIAVARLEGAGELVAPATRRAARIMAVVAVPLLVVAGWPGVVNQANFDFKPINIVPVIGVALALAVTVLVWRAAGAGRPTPWGRLDLARLAVIVGLVLIGLPWILADLGIRIANLPLFDQWFVAEGAKAVHRPVGVHIGHHHGLDGICFVTMALVLSRVLPTIGTTWARRTLSAWLGLIFVYGAANVLQDFWGEALVVSRWTRHQMPTVLNPALTPAWGIMLTIGLIAGAALVVRVEHQVTRKAAA